VSEPVFRSFDDDLVPLQRVKAQRNADGSESAVWERWLAFRQDPPYLSLYARWDPGMVVRRHGHNGPHVLVVLSGSVRIGDRECGPGTHVELPVGAAFGPHVAGPDGCELFEVMVGDPRSWGDDLDAYERVCAERGVTPLPDPPIDLPDWLEDERGRWVDSEGSASREA
jgi:hypothetical protein